MLKKDIAQLLAEDDAQQQPASVRDNPDWIADQIDRYMRKTKEALETTLASRTVPPPGNPFSDLTIHFSEDRSDSALACLQTPSLGELTSDKYSEVTCPACLRARIYDPVTGLRWDLPVSA